MALDRRWIASPNYSSRGGSAVRLIVCHTAEGSRTYQDLGAFFQNPSAGVSSHTGIDDTRNVIGEYVTPGNKAWTASNANPVAVQAELCAFAAWTEQEWRNQHHVMLENCAAWIAEEAARYGLPITELTPQQAQGGGRGVCQHIDLGSWGGGHVDCGAGFPFAYVLDMARSGGKPKPPPPDFGDDMIYLVFDEGGSAPLTFSNDEADGNHRVRLFCSRTGEVELDLAAAKEVLALGWEAGPQGLVIPAGVKKGAVRYVKKPGYAAPIAMVVSKSS
jgi:hypothetical protein